MSPTDVPEGYYSVPEDVSPLFKTGVEECPTGYYCPGRTADDTYSGLRTPKIEFTGNTCTDLAVDEGTGAGLVGTWNPLQAESVAPLGFSIGYSIASVAVSSTTEHTCDAGTDFSGLFAIDPTTGALSLGTTVQFLPEDGGCPFFTVTFEATDVPDNGDAPTTIQCVSTITVVDVNDPPAVDNDQEFYILERSEPTTPVTKDVSGEGEAAAVIASDPDEGQELLFSIETVDGVAYEYPDNPAYMPVFQIGFCSGQITLVTDSLEYDDVTDGYFTLNVKIADNSFPTPIEIFTDIIVYVVNVNDPPQFADGLDKYAYFTVDENSDIYSTHGDQKQRCSQALSSDDFATDPDGDVMTFSVTSSEAGLAFTIETNQEGDAETYLYVDGVINFEVLQYLAISITVSDSELEISDNFVVNVNDKV
jgi:hypothetical protein